MGADRTITLNRKVTPEEIESLLEGVGIGNTTIPMGLRWNERLWTEDWSGWKGENDIALQGSEIHLSYAYWGGGHAERAEQEADRIIKALREKELISSLGEWRY
ncbi:MAG: hypothetical protein KAX31_07320 [Thermoplasmata archaeon]|nr:hypothetical protein [Thermoplasmata archaeon]